MEPEPPAEADLAPDAATSNALSHPAPTHGGILVLDKHITYASLHRPLARFARRDLVPFVLCLAALLLLAAPALWYESQVSWLRSGEVIEEDAIHPDAIKLAPVGVPTIATETGELDPLLAAADDLDTTETDPTLNGTMPLTEIQAQIAALHVPEAYHFYFMYLLPVYLFFSAIAWLVLYWNVKLQVALRYSDEGSIDSARVNGRATHVRVVPVEHGGKSEICPLQRVMVPGATEPEIFFLFQKTKYILHASSVAPPSGHVNAWFAPIDFPTHEPLQSYIDRALQSNSMTEAQLAATKRKYGANVFDIPLPPFADLFKEHALAPFFVFQIFCVLLWCLDEYWYYSLVTLAMLVMFECTVVKRRLKNLEFMREMRIKPYQVNVYRKGKWESVLTSDLLPHDLISLVRPENDQHVIAADILLLTGSVVVNESMLTGESVPVHKENLEGCLDSTDANGVESASGTASRLEIDKEHKRNVLFGGTKILLVNTPTSEEAAMSVLLKSSSSTSSSSSASDSSDRIKPPPDGGCIGYVLRTGFNTSQGKLVRTILFSSETVSINQTESLLFIGVLLIFAITAAAYVCVKGLEDETRSRYKLMLNVIMIVTSVVPPELPMELSLAVNTSLMQLMRQSIFCTEPFRIPLAGAVDYAAFDKTGTLTKDEFVVQGIAGVPPIGTTTWSSDRPIGAAAATAASSSSSSTAVVATNSSAAAAAADPNLITGHANLPLATKYVIAGCHSLAFLPESAVKKAEDAAVSSVDQVIGDPLEKSSLLFIDWTVGRHDSASSKSGRERLRLLHKYPFSSALKRMSTIVTLEHDPGAPLRVLTKGAAEVMAPMFDAATLPANYHALHTGYARQGCRVLALGWKHLTKLTDCPEDRKSLKLLNRADDVESGLTFAGFLVLQCPLKPDSKEVIRHLKASTHQVMMITGDHANTACFVAREVGITTKEMLTLQVVGGATVESSAAAPPETTPVTSKTSLVWRPNWSMQTDGSDDIPFDFEYTQASLIDLTDRYDLCITGGALEVIVKTIQAREQQRHQTKNVVVPAAGGKIGVSQASIAATKAIALLVAHTKVFARTSPNQKALLIHWLNTRGYTTLMCGDGVNDTGAMKQAHIGVALIGEDAAKAAEKKREENKKKLAAGVSNPKTPAAMQLAKLKAQHAAMLANGGQENQRMKMQMQFAERMAKMEADMAVEENTTPRLGDASIASPFTSKVPLITSCVDIIRQGRCTLVTTLQMFNILGVNCLMSAYSMSVLYLDGIKWGDKQLMISSLSIAAFFFCLSRAEPLKVLSAERPQKKLFTWSMILSVLGQFAIHMAVLLTAIGLADPHTPQVEAHRSPHKEFVPNVLNTVVYLVSTTQTVATFAANYRGRPFMAGLTENSALYKPLLWTFLGMVLLASEAVMPLNEALELHELPGGDFRMQLIGLMMLDVGAACAYTRFLRKIFAVKPTAEQIRAAGASTLKVKTLNPATKKTQ